VWAQAGAFAGDCAIAYDSRTLPPLLGREPTSPRPSTIGQHEGSSTTITPRRILLLLLYLVAAGPHAVADERRPLIVAHRGLLRHAPENTLANFRACLELRFGFEFDVQATKDGRLVCIHDDAVDRTTDGTGRVAELTLAGIRRLDAGSWFHPMFAGQNVPTVEEVPKLVAEYRQNDFLVAVDLKAENVARDVV
jgi:glycerophosphoryl diester phosphodiesterase